MLDMQKLLQIKEKIVETIRQRGPELPVRIASLIGQNNLFTSAFMSELAGEQRIKISNMKVGSSPLYYISGQEEQLQKYTEHLNHKEKETFKLLKEKEILQDSEQEPAIRIALRSIKDFAVQINIRDKGEEKIFWKLHTIPNEKAKEIIERMLTPIKQNIQEIKQEKIEQIPEVNLENKQEKIIEKETVQEMPLAINTSLKKPTKIKEINSDFIEKVRENMQKMQYEIINEYLIKKKELSGKLKIKTTFGDQELYFIAKDKKKITLDDLVNTLQKAQADKMPAIILSTGEIDKKALNYYKEWNNLIKHQKIKI